MSNITVTNVNGRDVDAGQAKAWGSFMQWYQADMNPPEYPSDGSIGDTLNVSSIMDIGTGHISCSLTNVMVNGKYSANCTTHISGASLGGYGPQYSDMASVFDKTTTSFECSNCYANGYVRDGFFSGFTIHGDLA
ncbi:MAG: hypothetical protein HWE34_12705 [Methylocystaceae bacterium]|nr:hypothetical protein [Methylocystaceae bacterium]